jgi:hypothetical protein
MTLAAARNAASAMKPVGTVRVKAMYVQRIKNKYHQTVFASSDGICNSISSYCLVHSRCNSQMPRATEASTAELLLVHACTARKHKDMAAG